MAARSPSAAPPVHTHTHTHSARIRLLPWELTSLSLVKPRGFCTQEGQRVRFGSALVRARSAVCVLCAAIPGRSFACQRSPVSKNGQAGYWAWDRVVPPHSQCTVKSMPLHSSCIRATVCAKTTKKLPVDLPVESSKILS